MTTERTIQMTFGGKPIVVEVRITVEEGTTTGPNDGPDMDASTRTYEILSITDKDGNLLWHHGNGRPQTGSISPELRKAIEDEADKLEVLYE